MKNIVCDVNMGQFAKSNFSKLILIVTYGECIKSYGRNFEVSMKIPVLWGEDGGNDWLTSELI